MAGSVRGLRKGRLVRACVGAALAGVAALSAAVTQGSPVAATTVAAAPATTPSAQPTVPAKHVLLSVDGTDSARTTSAETVGAVLDEAGVDVGARDVVAPPADATVTDGQQIVVTHARRVLLTVDGITREVWVTAPSVEAALTTLDVRAEGAYVSASRSTRIPLAGIALSVRTPHRVTVVVAGHRVRVTTTAPTVAEVLSQLRIRISSRDVVTPALTAYPANGQVVTVTRIAGKVVSLDIAIPFATTRAPSAAMLRGTDVVVTAGHDGVRHQVWRVTYRNGKLVTKKLLSNEIAHAPVTEVITYGTRPPAPVAVDGYPTYGGLNWHALAACESGNDQHSLDGPYHGLYQFLLDTWQSVGASGDPADATIHEQTYRAWLLYQRDGRHPWPVCGKYL